MYIKLYWKCIFLHVNHFSWYDRILQKPFKSAIQILCTEELTVCCVSEGKLPLRGSTFTIVPWVAATHLRPPLTMTPPRRCLPPCRHWPLEQPQPRTDRPASSLCSYWLLALRPGERRGSGIPSRTRDVPSHAPPGTHNSHSHAHHVLHHPHSPALDPRFSPLLLPGVRASCSPMSCTDGIKLSWNRVASRHQAGPLRSMGQWTSIMIQVRQDERTDQESAHFYSMGVYAVLWVV